MPDLVEAVADEVADAANEDVADAEVDAVEYEKETQP